jgi:RNA polymerase sigma factor (sigma-70 family)
MGIALTTPVADELPIPRAELFARLADRQLDASYRLAAVILGDALEAEDAVSDATLAAWRSFGSLRDLARFDAWFARILVNGCRDRLRRRRRRPIVDLGAAIETIARRSIDSRHIRHDRQPGRDRPRARPARPGSPGHSRASVLGRSQCRDDR